MAASEVDIERALELIARGLNGEQLEEFDVERVQSIVDRALGRSGSLRVDAGGGLHDSSEARVGVLRRSPSGELITERSNAAAERADAAVPASED